MTSKRIVIFGWADSVHVHKWGEGLSKRGCDVKIISLDGWQVKGCETIILPRRNRLSYITNAKKAVREALVFKPDIIHVHYVSGFGLWALKTKFVPTVVSVWGTDISSGANSFFGKKILSRTFAHASKITATSHFLKSKVMNISPDIESKIEIIPFGVNECSDPEPMPSVDTFRLCFIKGHRPVYGPDILLKALAIVKKTNSDILLSIAGKGEMTGELKKMVKELNIEKNVEFNGFIDNKEIYKFIQKHHAVVMPSREEGFGVAALEAGICGRPVIATNVGGIPEVVDNNKTGLLVPSDDYQALAEAILKLADNRNLNAKMGQQGIEFVRENYTWEKSIDSMIRLYEGLIHG